MLRRHIVKWQILVAGLGMALVLALLGTVTFSVATIVVPDVGGTYVEAVVGRPRWINPVLCQLNEVDEDISSLVFTGLMRVGQTGELEPDLVESWEIGADGRSYTFTLRSDAKWHDGNPVIADDVVYTIRALQDPSYQGPTQYAELWRGVSIEKLSNTSVKFTLKDAYSPFLEFTTQGILPSHLLGKVAPRSLPEAEFNARPVGTGPFRVVKASLGQITLEAYDAFYGAKPFLRQIEFRFYDDYDVAATALRQEQVHAVGRLPSHIVNQMAGNERVTTYFAPESSKLTLLLFNTRDPVVSDVAVRQAVAFGLDVPRLIDKVLDGQGERAYGPVVPQSWAYKKDINKHDYNPVKARELLDNAGWVDPDGDGVRQKGDQLLRFTLLTNDNAQRITATQEIARQLEAIGFKIEVQATNWTGFVRDFLVPKKFQVALTEQWSPNADPDCYQFWHSSQIKEGLNFANWANRKADDLLERARRTADIIERTRLYHEFQTVFAEELPGIPLYYPVYDFALSKDVKGFEPGLLLRPADRFRNCAEWYVRTKRIVGAFQPSDQRDRQEQRSPQQQ
ncbi:MAG: ABC transporter substrate-binding protein [Chloroflexota bacterium]